MNQFLTRLPLIAMIGGAIVIIIVALAFLGLLPGKSPGKPPEVTLTIWGIEDTDQQWAELIAQFQKTYKHIKIQYVTVRPENYEEQLLNRLAEGTGPDIFTLKNAWVKRYGTKIYPLPQDILQFTPAHFSAAFVDAATDDLMTSHGDILGLPLYIDTPALLYDKDIFNSAAIPTPPKTWEEVMAVAERLTRRTTLGDIARSGIAIGAGRNVEHIMEIISSMIFQFGDQIVDRDTGEIGVRKGGENAIALYTSFANPSVKHFSWTTHLENSLEKFSGGNAAMAIGFFRDIPRIIAKNPHLALGVAPFPQRSRTEATAVYGSYFFPTVSAASLHPNEAWQFLLYAASPEGARLYLKNVGRPTARRDFIAFGSPQPHLDTFYRQALIAHGWRISDEKAVRTIFQESIDAVVNKSLTPAEAADRIEDLLNALGL